MTDFTNNLIFGPAYMDTVIKVTGPIAAELSAPLDQSLPVKAITADNSGKIKLLSDAGDCLIINLPAVSACVGGIYHLNEGILSRRCGVDAPPLAGTFHADSCLQQLGGMGAGYAKATGGLLRMPLGDDKLGGKVYETLTSHGIKSSPAILPGYHSDSTMIIQSNFGDKLAMGLRDTLLNWQPDADDFTLTAKAKAIIFCGAPNRFMANIVSHDLTAPVMCAPSLRNIDDTRYQLADLAADIDYLALNALEWEHLRQREKIIKTIPLISITDGARGSDIFLHGKAYFFPALPHPGPVDTNRAGETYAATLWKAILYKTPNFPNTGISAERLSQIAALASQQAYRQLNITGFAFPPDDWI